MLREQWKRIPWATNYEISTYGNVRNIKTGDYLHLTENEPGRYLRVMINGKRYYVHHLMLMVFQNWEPDGSYIGHIDGDKQNNRLDNLEIIDRGKGSRYRGVYVKHTCKNCANRNMFDICKDRPDNFFCALGYRNS